MSRLIATRPGNGVSTGALPLPEPSLVLAVVGVPSPRAIPWLRMVMELNCGFGSRCVHTIHVTPIGGNSYCLKWDVGEQIKVDVLLA